MKTAPNTVYFSRQPNREDCLCLMDQSVLAEGVADSTLSAR
jgi:hypothetical protein